MDGTRALIYKDENSLRIINRRGIEISHRYPELLEIAKNIRDSSAVIDGEIIVMDKTGKPDFYKLAEREHVDTSIRIRLLSETIPATFVAFDILWLDGQDLTNKPLIERKEVLKRVVEEGKRIKLCFYTENGEKLYKLAKRIKLEGVMGKEKNSLYLGKRSRAWLKIKYLKTLDCVISGYTKGEGWREKYLGALILGCYHQGKLRYVGRCGTGLDEKGYAELAKKLQKLKTDKCPFKEIPKMPSRIIPIWVKPKLICEVRFMNLSEKKIMRAPSFIRLRDDKLPEECILE